MYNKEFSKGLPLPTPNRVHCCCKEKSRESTVLDRKIINQQHKYDHGDGR